MSYIVVEPGQDNDREDVLTEEDEHGEERLHEVVRPGLHTDSEGTVQHLYLLQGLKIVRCYRGQRPEARLHLKYQYRAHDQERSQPDGGVDQEDAFPGKL